MIAYADNKVKMCRSLLGYNSIESDNIIITPLRNIFENLRAFANMPELNDDGFYSNFSFNTSSGTNVFVICVPQGMQAQDVMYVLNRKRILFLGYAGSLKIQNHIGDIVEAKKAFTNSDESIALSLSTRLKKIIVGYSPVLVGELAEEFHSIAKSQNCDAVDMETAYCAKAAIKNENTFSSVLLISDIIGKTEFWELDDNDTICFASGNKKLIELALHHFDKT